VRSKSRRWAALPRAAAGARSGARSGVRPAVSWLVKALVAGGVAVAVALTVVLLVTPVRLPGVEPMERAGRTDGLGPSVARLAGGSADVARVVLAGELPRVAGAGLERLGPWHADLPLGVATVAWVLGGGGLALVWWRRSGRGAGIVRVTAAGGVVGSLLVWPRQTLRTAGLPAELLTGLLTRWVDGQALVADYWSAVAGTATAPAPGTWPPLEPLVDGLTLAYLLPFAAGVQAAAMLAAGAQVVVVLGTVALVLELPRVLHRDGLRSLGRRVGLLLVGTTVLVGGLVGVLGLLWAAARLRTWSVVPAALGPFELLPRVALAWLGVVGAAAGWRMRRR
jgi:hypothetical protein